jgi:hypothetical protein
VEAALHEDMRLARGRACPTWEIGDAELAGLEALGGAEAALAPLSRRGDPQSVEEVLEWAGEPLATVEVAAMCGRDVEGVRAELERVARFEPVGSDGYWTATPGARAGSSA